MPTLLSTTDVPTVSSRAPACIGIDPGVSGGLAVIWPGGGVDATAMPNSERELWGWFEQFGGIPAIACLELVTGYVGGYNRKGGKEEADRTNPGAHMFAFGCNYGAVKMALTVADVSVDFVVPRTWQAALGLPTREKGIDGPAWKRVLKQHAITLYPDLKVTLSTCDALLLATYCKRRYGRGS